MVTLWGWGGGGSRWGGKGCNRSPTLDSILDTKLVGGFVCERTDIALIA